MVVFLPFASVFVDPCTNVPKQHNKSGRLKLYPNPVIDDLILEVPPGLLFPYTASIMDQLGTIIFVLNGEDADQDSSIKINTDKLVPGMHAIIIRDSKGVTLGCKFVK
jgi:hypothetical protein